MRWIYLPALLAVCLVSAGPLKAATVCINTQDISSSTPENHGASILFKMRDGSRWRNTLQGRCPDLDFNGFAWTVRNADQTVCENEQSLRVLRSGQVCLLGKFEKLPPASKPG
jgi:hypothetical protein